MTVWSHKTLKFLKEMFSFFTTSYGEIFKILKRRLAKNEISPASQTYYAQNLPVPAPNNVPRVLKISSKSVHCRRITVIAERVNTEHLHNLLH